MASTHRAIHPFLKNAAWRPRPVPFHRTVFGTVRQIDTNTKRLTPAAKAREESGITLTKAAASCRVSLSYLKRVERTGNASYVLAMRLSRLYGCSLSVFLAPNGQ